MFEFYSIYLSRRSFVLQCLNSFWWRIGISSHRVRCFLRWSRGISEAVYVLLVSRPSRLWQHFLIASACVLLGVGLRIAVVPLKSWRRSKSINGKSGPLWGTAPTILYISDAGGAMPRFPFLSVCPWAMLLLNIVIVRLLGEKYATSVTTCTWVRCGGQGSAVSPDQSVVDLDSSLLSLNKSSQVLAAVT